MSFRTVNLGKIQKAIPGDVIIDGDCSMYKILRRFAWNKRKSRKNKNGNKFNNH